MNSVHEIWRSRQLLLNMSKSDFKNRFSGSYFGVLWAVIQPLMTIIIFWFVFQVGFRAQPVSNVPFILWLCAAMIPWNFFTDGIINSTGAFTSYSFVVKKMVFKIGLLPLVKVISSFFLNIAFNLLLVIIYTSYHHFPGMQLFSILYFNLCLFALITVLAYLLSTLNVFFRDTSQIVGILLQFGIWLTPIMWEESVIPTKYLWIIKLNPIYYIINGYRESLINNTWFFAHPRQTLYFWVVVLIIGFFSLIFYKRMKPHFADVI